MSTLETILAQLSSDSAVSTKTAAELPAPSSAGASTVADTALAAVRSVTKTAQTASTGTAAPADDAVAALRKMAADTAALEDELLVKQAKAYGEAICDGFLERLAAASASIPALAKTAAETAGLDKTAEEIFARGVAEGEKRAAAEFDRGYQDTLTAVHKVAADLHLAGQADARTILAAISAQKDA